ncbi:protein Smaug homolog 2 isoform X3 [Lepidochelys kempii]|uniref:protein Smaug homolog 2 isoform X3 n=1 Tax=Lepidochelys kempii TaxID=8472 RepID=UPI003C6EBE62
MMFRDQVGILAGWFKGWNECEQTVALLSLLKRVTRTQARFLQLCLEHSLADCTEIHIVESEANSAAVISQWHQESKDKVVSLLLSHLPLLQPGNTEAKSEYMKLLQKVLAYSIESNLFIEESRQLLSYALIHPATTLDDRNSLALWLNHLEERLSSGYSGQGRGRPDTAYHSRQGSDEWQGPVDSGMGELGHGWQEKLPRENGHLPFHSSSSVPSAINSIGSNANAALPCQIHPSPLKRSMSLIPTSPQAPGEWMSPDELCARQAFIPGDHAPLSPQSSVASSGSEQTEEQIGSRNTFQEDGSGMKDVPSWLKSLRLHKYAALFSQMTYEEMMTLTEQHLESQNVTKGARHKIALSIQKLRERQSVLKSLEKDILEGGNLWNALQELQQIIITPIKAYSSLQAMPTPKEGQQAVPERHGAPRPGLDKATNGAEDKEPAVDGFPSQTASPCDGESATAPIAEGDIPGQFTRVMGKVCTQLLVSRPDEENITSYLQLIEKCLTHEMGLWFQLSPHSWICGGGCRAQRAAAVPDAPSSHAPEPPGAAEPSGDGRGLASACTYQPHREPGTTEPVVRQSRGQQQHARPEPQLGPAHPFATRPHVPAGHHHVPPGECGGHMANPVPPAPLSRLPDPWNRPGDQPHAGVAVPEHD